MLFTHIYFSTKTDENSCWPDVIHAAKFNTAALHVHIASASKAEFCHWPHIFKVNVKAQVSLAVTHLIHPLEERRAAETAAIRNHSSGAVQPRIKFNTGHKYFENCIDTFFLFFFYCGVKLVTIYWNYVTSLLLLVLFLFFYNYYYFILRTTPKNCVLNMFFRLFSTWWRTYINKIKLKQFLYSNCGKSGAEGNFSFEKARTN